MYESTLYNVRDDTETKVFINLEDETDEDIKSVIKIIDPSTNLKNFIGKIIIEGKQSILLELLEQNVELRTFISDYYLSAIINYKLMNDGEVDLSGDVVINSEHFTMTKFSQHVPQEVIERASNLIILDMVNHPIESIRIEGLRRFYKLLIDSYPDEQSYKDIYNQPSLDVMMDDVKKYFVINKFGKIVDLDKIIIYLDRGITNNNLRELISYTKKVTIGSIVNKLHKVENGQVTYTNFHLYKGRLEKENIIISFEYIGVMSYFLDKYDSITKIVAHTDLKFVIKRSLFKKDYKYLLNLLGDDESKWKVMSQVIISHNLKLDKLKEESIPYILELMSRVKIDKRIVDINPKQIKLVVPELTLAFTPEVRYFCLLCKYSTPEILKYNILSLLSDIFKDNKDYECERKELTTISTPVKTITCYEEIKSIFYKENINLDLSRFTLLINMLCVDYYELKTDMSKFTYLYDYYCDVSHLIMDIRFHKSSLKHSLISHRS